MLLVEVMMLNGCLIGWCIWEIVNVLYVYGYYLYWVKKYEILRLKVNNLYLYFVFIILLYKFDCEKI